MWTITLLKNFQVITRYSGPWEEGLMMKSPFYSFFITSTAGWELMFRYLGWAILLNSGLLFFRTYLSFYLSYLFSMIGLSSFLSSNRSFSRSIEGWIALTIVGKQDCMQSCLIFSCRSGLSLWGKSRPISTFKSSCSSVGWSSLKFL